jgi:prepilin-type N-terminal cleavage/methylation domain-containing protein
MQGFTLTESMVVLAILSAVVISAPAFNGWFQGQGAGLAAEQLRADLQLARMMAINQKRDCAIVLNDPTPNQYRNSLNLQTVDLAAYRGGVGFLAIGPDKDDARTQITFNRQGMSTSAAAVNVFLTDQAQHAIYRIQVRGPGGISVARWHGGGWH